jgi:hypothetical protein
VKGLRIFIIGDYNVGTGYMFEITVSAEAE